MKVHHKAHIKWPLALLSILTLTLFLVACGTSEGSTTTTPTPTPTPTPSGNAYSGNGYTLRYPQGWTANKQTLGPVETTTFTSTSDPTAILSIAVTPATPLTGLDQSFATAQNTLKSNANFQVDTTDLPPTSIGGDTWKETGGTYSQNGTQIKGVVLADQHPSSTGSIYVITLTDKANSYDQDYSAGFKPMLDSFQFS